MAAAIKTSFKHCEACAATIPTSDGHSKCLPCLGETHRVDTCPICRGFTKQTRCNRASQLGALMWEQALQASSAAAGGSPKTGRQPSLAGVGSLLAHPPSAVMEQAQPAAPMAVALKTVPVPLHPSPPLSLQIMPQGERKSASLSVLSAAAASAASSSIVLPSKGPPMDSMSGPATTPTGPSVGPLAPSGLLCMYTPTLPPHSSLAVKPWWRSPRLGGRVDGPAEGVCRPALFSLFGGAVEGSGVWLCAGAWPRCECTDDHSKNYSYRDPEFWRAVIGLHHLYRYQPQVVKARVSTIIIHSDYDKVTYENDIALFQLEKYIPYSDYIQPICLPKAPLTLTAANHCYISGWGATREKGKKNPAILQETEINIIPQHICGSPDWYWGIVKENMLCAGSEHGGVDSCQGDSGGPLMCYFPDVTKFYLVGITSFGVGCGRPKRPGVYTRAANYRRWIEWQFEYNDSTQISAGSPSSTILLTAGLISLYLAL